MRKLILADVDGTMLRHGTEQASDRVVDATERFESAGNVLVPVTSRTARMMGSLATQLGLRSLGVLDGGATVFDFGTNARDEALSRWMNPEQTKAVLRAIGAHCTELYFGEDSRQYTPDAQLESVDQSPSVFAVYNNVHETAVQQALASIDGVDAHYNKYEDDGTRSCVQVVWHGVSKRSGVELLLADPRFADIRPENVMAIGDGKPDLDLFAAVPAAAWRVAVDNAHPDLLRASSYTAPHVNEDGFAIAVEHFMAA